MSKRPRRPKKRRPSRTRRGLPARNPTPLAKNIPQKQGSRATRADVAYRETFFQGPTPDPDTLLKYKDVDPTFPERIMAMAERQAKHRQELEKRHLRGEIRTRYFGLVSALLAVAGIGALCAYMVKLGHPTAATSTACSVIVALAGTFLYGVKAKKNQVQLPE